MRGTAGDRLGTDRFMSMHRILSMGNQFMYNVECVEVRRRGDDLPYNETEIVLEKKGVRYAVPGTARVCR